MIGSGCVSHPVAVPYCPPDRPELVPIDVVVQQEIIQLPDGVTTLAKFAGNDLKLKSHIKVLEQLGEEVNKANGTSCE